MPDFERTHLKELLEAERLKFLQEHPRSSELFQRAGQSMQGGVPMLWMIRWAGTFPVFVKEARGAHFVDVDGHTYTDFCLGDTGAMTGHSPEIVAEAVARRLQG
jgi:glutamate-1-semialdehyde 2,1-aminomutase